MSEVTYAKTRQHCPPQLPRRPEPPRHNVKDLSSYRHKKPPARCSSWKILAVILGIICLALIAAVGFLATKFIQNSNNAKKICLKEGNKKVNQNSINADKHPGNSSCNKEAYEKVWKPSTCSTSWYQHGADCYFFSRMMLPWDKCSGYCRGLNSSFAKMDTNEAMDFVLQLSKLQCEMRQEKFYISLSFNKQRKNWFWQDGTDYTLSKLLPTVRNADNKCIHVTNGLINAVDCQTDGYCVCKKKIF